MDLNKVVIDIRNGNCEFRKLPRHIRHIQCVAMVAVTRCGENLRYVGSKLQDNYDIVHMAVSIEGSALVYASDRLRDDFNIVMSANSQNYQSPHLKYASSRLKADYDIVLRAVTSSYECLRYAHSSMKDNYEIVLRAVLCCPSNLKHASLRLKADYNIVMAAVSRWGHCSLKYVDKKMWDNYDIVLLAVTNHYSSLYYASDRLKDNYDIAIKGVSHSWWAFRWLSCRLKNDYNIINIASYQHNIIGYLPDKLQKFKNYRGWVKGHIGNGNVMYENDYDVKFQFGS